MKWYYRLKAKFIERSADKDVKTLAKKIAISNAIHKIDKMIKGLEYER